jgi:hypothetical protein
MQIVGIMLVRNEDVFLEQATRNVAAFCDRIHVVDHVSTDRTPALLRSLAREFDHIEVSRARHARVSHQLLEPYIGSETWVLRVDGDELYCPTGLEQIRAELESGAFRASFRVQGTVLHCVTLDLAAATASGYLSPPSRPITSLFNLAAADSWTGCPERLHGGNVAFRPGYDWKTVTALSDNTSWEESPLRYLHTCFLRRSSLDEDCSLRRSLGETGMYRRGLGGSLRRAIRRPRLDPLVLEIQARGSNWKHEKYMRGERVTVDASPFLESLRVKATARKHVTAAQGEAAKRLT